MIIEGLYCTEIQPWRFPRRWELRRGSSSVQGEGGPAVSFGKFIALLCEFLHSALNVPGPQSPAVKYLERRSTHPSSIPINWTTLCGALLCSNSAEHSNLEYHENAVVGDGVMAEVYGRKNGMNDFLIESETAKYTHFGVKGLRLAEMPFLAPPEERVLSL